MEVKSCNIAITGCIGSGKTTVSNYLLNSGYKVVFTDEISRNMLSCKIVYKKLQSIINDDIFIDKKLNLKYISNYFDNYTKDEETFERWYQQFIGLKIKNLILKNKDSAIFYDIPLLRMKKIEYMFDFIWLINTEREKCVTRVTERNNYDINKINHLIKSSTFYYNGENVLNLTNNTGLINLFTQVDDILKYCFNHK